MENSLTVNEKTGEIVEQSTKLVFGTQDANGIIAKATSVADKLVDIVEKAKLYNMITGKKFVRAEGWTAMAAMLGVFPSTEYCRRLERDDELAYEAKVILRHISGAEVGSGEAICSSKERNWSARDEYAVKSMAQTRAVGKACRLSFSWIMALAGYEACNAEEIPNEKPTLAMPYRKSEKAVDRAVSAVPPDENGSDIEFSDPPEEVSSVPPDIEQETEERIQKAFPGAKVLGKPDKLATEKQVGLIRTLRGKFKVPEPAFDAYLKETHHVFHTDELSNAGVQATVEWLERYGNVHA